MLFVIIFQSNNNVFIKNVHFFHQAVRQQYLFAFLQYKFICCTDLANEIFYIHFFSLIFFRNTFFFTLIEVLIGTTQL